MARNSLAYVAQVFASGEARRTLVSVQDARHANDLHGIAVDKCIEVGDVYGWYSQQHELIADDGPAQIVFTSGTEGNPKAIVLSYANLADTAGRIIKAVGGRAYLSPRGFDPLELVRMLESGEVNSLSAVPTLLRILLESPEVIDAAGRKLVWMEIGSPYMSASEKRGVRELFPNARIVQHYGLTEASRSTFLDVSSAAQEALESVGRPEGTVEIGFDAQGRKSVVGEIAAASIFTYLVHFQVRDIVRALSGGGRPWRALCASVVVGIGCAYVYAYLQRLVARTAFGRRFFAFLAGQVRLLRCA